VKRPVGWSAAAHERPLRATPLVERHPNLLAVARAMGASQPRNQRINRRCSRSLALRATHTR
jgi:hypothetical protein